jgi:hypothetical protein
MMPVPAWSYLYTKQQYPARGIIAWAVLVGDGESSYRNVVPGRLARLFDISLTNARMLLRRGDGVFWRLTRKRVLPYSRQRLWKAVAGQSVVAEDELVGIDPKALSSIAATRAWLAQPALTRGPIKPISIGTSACLLDRSPRAVSAYRSHLVGRGRLLVIPQYERIREHVLSLRAEPLEPGDFVNKGWIYRRCADVVLVKNSVGDFVTWAVYHKGRTLAPRRYFESSKQLEQWTARGRPVAKDVVIKVYDEWVSVANVSSVV